MMPKLRALCALLVVLGGGACATPEPTGSQPPSTGPTASPSAPLVLSEALWYEVDRVGDVEANSRRDLLIGSLDGVVNGRISLGVQASDERAGGLGAFAWTDPQADGIFNGRVLVWGRAGQARLIEAVDARDGSLEPLVEAEDTVQVATADGSLSRVFFVTVDEASNRPDGLWVDDVSDGAKAVQLTYVFGRDAVSNLFKYRLVANNDGSLVAVQPNQGTVTVIDVEADASAQVEPGGPIIGFADNYLMAFGAKSATDRRPLIAFNPVTMTGQTVVEEVSSAQVISGSDGALIGVMRIDPLDPRSYEISAVSILTGEARVAYLQDPSVVGPLLARRDRSFLGFALPPDWVVLVDSFIPFIEGPAQAPKDLPPSSYPKLVNLRTSETFRVGPFVEDAQ